MNFEYGDDNDVYDENAVRNDDGSASRQRGRRQAPTKMSSTTLHCAGPGHRHSHCDNDHHLHDHSHDDDHHLHDDDDHLHDHCNCHNFCN